MAEELDPKTGLPAESVGGEAGAQPTPGADDMMHISKGDYENMLRNAGKLDFIEKSGGYFGAQPAAPVESARPTLADQLAPFDKGIDEIDKMIDTQVAEGRPVSDLLKKRSALSDQRSEISINAKYVEPLRATGLHTLEQLTERVMGQDMVYKDLPEIKKTMNEFMNQLTPEQKANPETRKAAYELATGKHINVIIASEKEKHMRAAIDNPAPGGGKNSRSLDSKGAEIPEPSKYLNAENIQAIRAKGQTVDEYYRSLSYKGGWAEFWEKRGKAYFVGE
jgi:hypothetical protein